MTETEYCYESVTVWSPLTPNRITEAVITDRYDTNYEQKLINEYNAAINILQLGLSSQCEDNKTPQGSGVADGEGKVNRLPVKRQDNNSVLS
nr:MAG TPA_asm: hypothetical protein [Caudoviricetes sp.]